MRTFHILLSTPFPLCGQGFSRLLSPHITGHSREFCLVESGHRASIFLRPFAPRALPRFHTTMDALTPAQWVLRASRTKHPPFPEQVSPVNTARPSTHSVTTHLTQPFIALCCSPSVKSFRPPASDWGCSPHRGLQTSSKPLAFACVRFGVRSYPAASPLRPAVSCSLSYGLRVRFQLLSTPPRGDAVTFSFQERASPGRGLAPL